MDKYICNESNGLWHERCGDYYLPCLAPDGEKNIGIRGERHRRCLKEHRCISYNELYLNGALNDRAAEIERRAEKMFKRLTAGMAKREDITEQLKASDQMAWVGAMNNTRARAEEVVDTSLLSENGIIFLHILLLKRTILSPVVLVGISENTLIFVNVHGMSGGVEHTSRNVGAMVGNTLKVRQEV